MLLKVQAWSLDCRHMAQCGGVEHRSLVLTGLPPGLHCIKIRLSRNATSSPQGGRDGVEEGAAAEVEVESCFMLSGDVDDGLWRLSLSPSFSFSGI